MSEADSQADIPVLEQVADHDAASEYGDTSRGESPLGGHEGTDAPEPPTDAVLTADSLEGSDTAGRTAANGAHSSTDQLDITDLEPKAKPDANKQAAVKSKPPMSVKPPTTKPNGGPSSPLVKRIINSGTFGAGNVRPAASKPTVVTQSATVKSSIAPVLKKSTSASAVPPKAPMASSRTVPPSNPPPSRRLSVASAKPAAPPLSKPSLSASASAKPAAPTSVTRPSVVSPAGSATSSAARPRASVSEGVKRAPLSARQSIAPGTKPPSASAAKLPAASAAKPPPARSSGTATAKPTRTSTSISSIREVKEDTKALEELQGKLKEATESLVQKTDNVAELENQVNQLRISLETALADVTSKNALAEQLVQEKSLLEKDLTEAKDGLTKLESGQQDSSVLASLQQDLEAAKASSVTQTTLVEKLRAQIQSLEEQVTSSKETLETLRSSASSNAADLSSVEHEALLKAKADFTAIAAEAEALKLSHTAALEEAHAKVKRLETLIEELNVQLAGLKTDKEENASKLSELEIEILELRESQEAVEDERERLLARIKTLEEELLKTSDATRQALENAKAREEEFSAQVGKIQSTHSDAIQAASEEQAKLVASLEALKVELVGALEANKSSKTEALEVLEGHARKLAEAEQAYLNKQSELSDEIRRITTELEGQESFYNTKVDAVKREHDTLLQEAFERAKNEASIIHAQELQALRANSAATMEQIQSANQSSIENLKKEHAESLSSEVNRLEKSISTLKLDLKATQDDLLKAKAGLESSRAEVESLTHQRDEARAAVASTPETSVAHVEETTRLTKELANTKDDLAAVTEMLNLSKVSLTEMSNNQAKELEEAAKIRAEEVTKLRASHNEEIAALSTQKSEILIKLSDLEGEFSTLKASVNAEPAAPKSNGNGTIPPPSPGVTKEELQRLHEAHNLKIYDLQAEHEKMLKALKEDLQAAENKTVSLQEEVGRKTMEIQYLEQDQEENQEHITRLKEDLDALTERLSKEQSETTSA